MAVTSPAPMSRPRQNLFWSRLHFSIRLLGLTGAMIACICAVLAGVRHQLDPLYAATTVRGAAETFLDMGRNIAGNPSASWTMLLLLCGTATALLTLTVELLAIVAFTATRRSAFGFNALVQGALAAVLLVGVNVWSYRHYERVDCTREKQFTLPDDVRHDLAQLDPNSRTTLIVYQRHKVFGLLPDNKPQDEYDSAAERKVVDKVRDLVEQFRAIGPRIRVETIDTQSRDYKKERLQELVESIVEGPRAADEPKPNDERLKKWKEEAASLRKTIESAPENSLFFCSRGENDKLYVQRLSFNDFYLLDKTASQDDRDGRGNLVLLYQGMQPFVRHLLHLEERRPRVGIAVIHPVLSSMRDHDWGLHGLRLALEKRGFEVKDIVLKKWSQTGPPTAAAATVEESALERLDERQKALETTIRTLEGALPALKKGIDEFRTAIADQKKRDELSRRYADQLEGTKLTVDDVRMQVNNLQFRLEYLDAAIPIARQRLAEVREEKSKLNVPALREQQRMTDMQAKLNRLLADCDVLIVPRMTLRNVADPYENVPARVYKLDDPQIESIKDFLKAGKPILTCFGPTNTSPDDRSLRPGEDAADGLEKLLGDLGIKFGKQTVLFDREVEGFADAKADADLGSGQLEPPPPILFDWQSGVGRPLAYRPSSDKPNRLRQSLQLDARALGRDSEGKPIPLDIRIRHPRPIYYIPPKGAKALDYDPDFLMTDARSWNEDQPFPTNDGIPQFEQPKTAGKGRRDLDVGKDALESRRRGPFPIGVALETRLPTSWFGSAAEEPPMVRVAAIGQGGFFTGKKLEPGEEILFVNTLNWLLGRDEQLPVADRVWSYPRVNDTIAPNSEAEYLWLGGVRVGLPALFAFLGLVVLLFRRLR
jgi:prefoldin subunit 5